MKKIVFIICLLLTFNKVSAYTGNESIRLLTHSTGNNLYNEGGVASWLNSYNTSNGTSYSVSRVDYPSNGYPWNNYPYDWWNLWVNEACSEGNSSMECLDNLAATYDVIVWKQCYPGADVLADTGEGDVGSSRKSLENYKLQYRSLRNVMGNYPETNFVVFTLVPRHRLATNASNASRAKEFVDWVKNEWLLEDGQDHTNINIFDFWGYYAGGDNYLKYEYERSHTGSDSHPNTLANQTIGPIFSQFLVDVIEVDQPEVPTSPVIESYSQNTGLISGSNFGTKIAPTPLNWDNFEDGSVDINANIGEWGGVNDLDLSTTVSRGDYSAHWNFRGEGSATLRVQNDDVSQKWFVSHWVYLDNNWEWGEGSYGSGDEFLSNIKMVRFWSPSSINENFYTQLGWGVGSNATNNFEHLPTTITSFTGLLTKNMFTKGQWHQLQFQVIDSSEQGVADGEYKVWFNGALVHDYSGFIGRENYANLKRPFFIGFYNAWGGGGNGHDNDYYMDDVYSDNSISRVEICQGSTWENKHLCDMQIPDSWSNTEIISNSVKNTFSNGDVAYLYVVNSDAEVNSEGFAITIFVSEEEPSSVRIDVNQDSVVNATDAMLALRNSLGLDMLSTAWQASAITGDANCDGDSNTSDALLIFRYSLGLDMGETGWCEQ